MIIWSFRALTPMQSWSVGLQCVKKIKENNTNTVTVRALVMSTQPNHASHNITWTFMRYVMLIMSLYTLILKLFHLNSNIGAFFHVKFRWDTFACVHVYQSEQKWEKNDKYTQSTKCLRKSYINTSTWLLYCTSM